MEDIRCLLIKHVTKFDRRVEVHLKNITLKEALFLFLFSCEKAFGEVKQEYFGRRARNRPILEVSRLLECICRHFLSWIDRNYLSIFDKHHVFRSRILLSLSRHRARRERKVHRNDADVEELALCRRVPSGHGRRPTDFCPL